MDNIDRVLGRLENHMDSSNERLKTIEEKLEEIQAFKWKLMGASVSISAIVGFVIHVVELVKQS